VKLPTLKRPVPVAPAALRARGADFSSYQSYATTIAAVQGDGGLHFGIVKFTEGLDYINPALADQVNVLRNLSALAGAYHFLTPDDGARQWDHFEQQLARTGVRLVAADYEAPGVTDNIARSFIRRGQQRGYKVGLYGSRGTVTRKLGQDWNWAAWWNPTPPPFAWDIWQFAAGEGGAPDWNIYRGNVNDLGAFGAKMAAPASAGYAGKGNKYVAYLKLPPLAWWIHDEATAGAIGPLSLPGACARLLAYAARHPRSSRYSLERK
jgi:hypothetical protein